MKHGLTGAEESKLEFFYRHSREDIALALGRLISSPGIEIDSAAIQLDALERYGKTKVRFVDCVIATTAVAEKISIASFDQDFRKFIDVGVEIQ